MRGNVRESAIGKVGESAKVLFGSRADVIIQVGGYCARLVLRAGEVIAEASGSRYPGDLRADGLSAADCGDVRTCAWKLWRELWRHFAIVRLAGCANACDVDLVGCLRQGDDREGTYLCRLQIREQKFLLTLTVQSSSTLAWHIFPARSAQPC